MVSFIALISRFIFLCSPQGQEVNINFDYDYCPFKKEEEEQDNVWPIQPEYVGMEDFWSS